MRTATRWAASLVAVVVVGVLAAVLVVSTRSSEVVAPRVAGAAEVAPVLVAGDWAVPPPAPTQPTSFTVADAVGPTVQVFDAPDRPAEALDNPTWEGLAVVFLVLEREAGPAAGAADDWLQVRVSSRPNSRVAWIRAADVTLRTVPNWVKVEIGAKRVTVFHGDTALMSTTVATGKGTTPTPVGSFFVDGIVPLDPPHQAYGAGQVSVSGFSETLDSFGGGIGQIALHGTFATGLLGQETSNGCVRLDNASITTVMDLAPTGTPVEIVP